MIRSRGSLPKQSHTNANSGRLTAEFTTFVAVARPDRTQRPKYEAFRFLPPRYIAFEKFQPARQQKNRRNR
jgi:hypothetical protein